jgi:hypothetical protein
MAPRFTCTRRTSGQSCIPPVYDRGGGLLYRWEGGSACRDSSLLEALPEFV